MRIPRGLQTGGVPTGPTAFDSGGAARIADQVAQFTDSLIEEQARAEFADAISSAEASTRDYLDQAKQIRVNEDTGRPAFETAEQDFENFYDELIRSATDSLSTNRAKDQVQAQLGFMRDQAQADVRAIARGHRIDDIVTRTNSAVDRYIAAGEYDAARLALGDQKSFYSPQRFDAVSALIDSAESGAIHDQAVNDVMAEHAAAMYAGQSAEFIRNFRATSVFDDEETRKIAGKMATEQNRYQAEQDELDTEFKAQEARAMQARLFHLDMRIDQGDAAAFGDIADLVARGDITATEGTVKRRRLEKQLEENREVVDGYAMLSAGAPLDPKNKAHRRLVDRELTAILQETGDIAAPETRTAVARLVKLTNIIPDQLKQVTNAARITGSVEAVAATADVVARISETAPIQYAQFSPDDRAFYGMVNSLIRANMDPTDAVDAVRERMNAPEADRKIADQRYSAALRGDPNIEAATNWAQNQFDAFLGHHTIFGREPAANAIPNDLLADYESLTRVFFDKTQDIETARSLAQQELTATWARTEINGEAEVMRYAPELIHGDWVIDQVTEEMNAVGVSPGVWEIVSDPITARTGGQSYAIMRRTELGLEPITVPDADGNLQVARYVPDYASSKKAQKQGERAKKFVSEANKERELLLNMDAKRQAQREEALDADPFAAAAEFGDD